MSIGQVSVAWLCRHEWRLQIKLWGLERYRWLVIAPLVAGCAIGLLLAIRLRDLPPQPDVQLIWIVTLTFTFVATLMLSQALLQATRTLFSNSDMAFFMTAPVSANRVFAAKLLGIAAGVLTLYGAFILPIVIPIALLHYAPLLGAVPMLVALSLWSSAFAMLLLIAVARVCGPRVAQVFGNIGAAVFGGLFFLIAQLTFSGSRGGGFLASKPGSSSNWTMEQPLLVLAHGALGDVRVLVITVVATAVILWATVRSSGNFVRAILQDVRVTSSYGTSASRGPNGPFGAIVAKELRVLGRERELLFQVTLRLMYLVPLIYLVIQGKEQDPFFLAGSVAFLTGQLCSSIAWLMISGEDAPELLATAPLPRTLIHRAKLTAALAPSILLSAAICLIVAWWHPFAAASGFIISIAVATAVGFLEVALAKPQRKSGFRKNKDGSFGRIMLTLTVSLGISVGGAWGAGLIFRFAN